MTVLAVALLIFSSPKGRIFCLEELQSKPQYEKRSGMLSFPIETIKEKDGESRDEALERLLREEVGYSLSLSDPDFLGEVCMEFSSGEKSKIFCYTVFSPEEFQGCPSDTDIRFFGWMSFEELRSLGDDLRRREVLPVIQLISEWKSAI